MNKTIKKFLCNYFGDDYNIVTVGSVISLGIFYSILLLFASLFLYAFYSSIEVYRILYHGEPYAKLDFKILIGEIGITLEVILLIVGFLKFLEYISKIEITRCERKE